MDTSLVEVTNMPEAVNTTLTTKSPTTQIRDMQTYGFSIIRNAISPEQVQELRNVIETHFRRAGRMRYGGKIQLRALHNVSGLAQAALTEDLAQVIRSHTCPTEPLLTGECDIMMNTTSGWHKDITPDMNMGTDVFHNQDFAVYKVGIYLQDQDDGSPASFRVRPRSQLMEDGAALPPQRLETKAGDAVVFDVRIDHAGQPPDMTTRVLRRVSSKVAPIFGQDPDSMLTRIRAGIGRGKQNRLAFFMTFGPDAYWTHEYEKSGRHRHGPPPPLDVAAQTALRDLHLEMIRPS